MTESISLHTFCKNYDLPKTTVHRYCKANNISTSEGLSVETVNQIKAHFRVTETALEQGSNDSQMIHVPRSHIQVLPPEKMTALAQLADRYAKPKTLQTVNLNGSAEQVVNGVMMFAEIVDEMKASNDEAEQLLNEREETIDNAAEILESLTKEANSEFNRNLNIAEKAETVESKAEQLKKKLAKLQSILNS